MFFSVMETVNKLVSVTKELEISVTYNDRKIKIKNITLQRYNVNIHLFFFFFLLYLFIFFYFLFCPLFFFFHCLKKYDFKILPGVSKKDYQISNDNSHIFVIFVI